MRTFRCSDFQLPDDVRNSRLSVASRARSATHHRVRAETPRSHRGGPGRRLPATGRDARRTPVARPALLLLRWCFLRFFRLLFGLIGVEFGVMFSAGLAHGLSPFNICIIHSVLLPEKAACVTFQSILGLPFPPSRFAQGKLQRNLTRFTGFPVGPAPYPIRGRE
jgi:hypothetical protein